MTKLTFSIAANSPRSITRVKLRDLPDDTIYFGGPIVASGKGLGELAALKIDLYRDGKPIATLTEFDDLTATDTSISFHLTRNSSSHPDGDWWGQRVLLTATIGGFAVKRWLTFANPMP